MQKDMRADQLQPGDIFVKPEQLRIERDGRTGYAHRPVEVVEVKPARTDNVKTVVLRDRETGVEHTIQLFNENMRTVVRPAPGEGAPVAPQAQEMHAIREATQDFCGAMLRTWIRNNPSRNKAEGQLLFGTLLVENAYIMVGVMLGTEAAASVLNPPPNVRATWDMSIAGTRAAMQAFEKTK